MLSPSSASQTHSSRPANATKFVLHLSAISLLRTRWDLEEKLVYTAVHTGTLNPCSNARRVGDNSLMQVLHDKETLMQTACSAQDLFLVPMRGTLVTTQATQSVLELQAGFWSCAFECRKLLACLHLDGCCHSAPVPGLKTFTRASKPDSTTSHRTTLQNCAMHHMQRHAPKSLASWTAASSILSSAADPNCTSAMSPSNTAISVGARAAQLAKWLCPAYGAGKSGQSAAEAADELGPEEVTGEAGNDVEPTPIQLDALMRV